MCVCLCECVCVYLGISLGKSDCGCSSIDVYCTLSDESEFISQREIFASRNRSAKDRRTGGGRVCQKIRDSTHWYGGGVNTPYRGGRGVGVNVGVPNLLKWGP